jgi:hypothetical protein
MHDALPSLSWYVPAGHVIGVEEPSGQNDPAGHSKLVFIRKMLESLIGSAVPDGQ